MKNQVILILSFFIISSVTIGQNLDDLDSYTVDEFYKRIDLDYGTLDANGYSIDHIYVITEVDSGTYEIELTDGDGDLYEIKGTNIYVTFNGYFGYAGYSQECIMEVSYYSTIYKLD